MRHFYLLLGGVLLAFSAHAQLGLRAGPTWAGQAAAPLSKQAGGSSQATTSRVGYQAGLTYCFALGRRWALVPELYFSRERQQVRIAGGYDSDNDFEASYELTGSYVNLPVLARLRLGRVYLEAGPQASLLVGGHGRGTRTYTGPWAATVRYSPVVDQAVTDSYARFDAGASLGLGVRVAAGLGLSVRAYQGLVGCNLSDQSSTSPLPKGSSQAYRQTLQLALTYELPHR